MIAILIVAFISRRSGRRRRFRLHSPGAAPPNVPPTTTLATPVATPTFLALTHVCPSPLPNPLKSHSLLTRLESADTDLATPVATPRFRFSVFTQSARPPSLTTSPTFKPFFCTRLKSSVGPPSVTPTSTPTFEATPTCISPAPLLLVFTPSVRQLAVLPPPRATPIFPPSFTATPTSQHFTPSSPQRFLVTPAETVGQQGFLLDEQFCAVGLGVARPAAVAGSSKNDGIAETEVLSGLESRPETGKCATKKSCAGHFK